MVDSLRLIRSNTYSDSFDVVEDAFINHLYTMSQYYEKEKEEKRRMEKSLCVHCRHNPDAKKTFVKMQHIHCDKETEDLLEKTAKETGVNKDCIVCFSLRVFLSRGSSKGRTISLSVESGMGKPELKRHQKYKSHFQLENYGVCYYFSFCPLNETRSENFDINSESSERVYITCKTS